MDGTDEVRVGNSEGSLWADQGGAPGSGDEGRSEQRIDATRPPTRVCRKCSTQSETAGDYCPHCGASFVGRRRVSRRARRVLAAAGVLILLGGAAAAYAAKHHHDQLVAAEHRKEEAAAREHARQRAAQRAAANAAAEAARARRRVEIAVRRSVITALKGSITKDARKDVADGLLDGPILRTACTPVGGGNVDDLAAHTGNWSCLAVTTDNADGTSEGYAFAATVNYDDGTYTWHLGH